MVGLVLAIAGAATGGGLTTDDYHEADGGSAHKALGGLTVAAAAIQVRCRRMQHLSGMFPTLRQICR